MFNNKGHYLADLSIFGKKIKCCIFIFCFRRKVIRRLTNCLYDLYLTDANRKSRQALLFFHQKFKIYVPTV